MRAQFSEQYRKSPVLFPFAIGVYAGRSSCQALR